MCKLGLTDAQHEPLERVCWLLERSLYDSCTTREQFDELKAEIEGDTDPMVAALVDSGAYQSHADARLYLRYQKRMEGKKGKERAGIQQEYMRERRKLLDIG